jgi:hypothetical protein
MIWRTVRNRLGLIRRFQDVPVNVVAAGSGNITGTDGPCAARVSDAPVTVVASARGAFGDSVVNVAMPSYAGPGRGRRSWPACWGVAPGRRRFPVPSHASPASHWEEPRITRMTGARLIPASRATSSMVTGRRAVELCAVELCFTRSHYASRWPPACPRSYAPNGNRGSMFWPSQVCRTQP